MRQIKIIFIYLIFLMFIAPLSGVAQVPPVPEIPNAVPAEEVQKFIEEYKMQFMKMDPDAFMALFSKEATENRMLSYDDIREAYHRTIAFSRSIVYNLEIYSIQTYPHRAFVTGHYKIIQAFKSGGKKRVFQGDIQWDLSRENGLLKIKEVNYGKNR